LINEVKTIDEFKSINPKKLGFDEEFIKYTLMNEINEEELIDQLRLCLDEYDELLTQKDNPSNIERLRDILNFWID